MAATPESKLYYPPDIDCGDCGLRRAELPEPLPKIGDDFDWLVRDYDGFRMFMLEQLAARFSERRRWTPADMEVVMVETLSVVLDQLSDSLDRIHGEAFLQTARRSDSVRRLLAMIGYDAVQEAGYANLDDPVQRALATAELERLWQRKPHLMEAARAAGPRAIHTQERMVTTSDYGERLQDHPLVLRAHATAGWSGCWSSLRVTVILHRNLLLDDALTEAALGGAEAAAELCAQIDAFNRRAGLDVPAWEHDPTARTVLRPYLDARRMVGQEVLLDDADPVGIVIQISVRGAASYFQSELNADVARVLGNGIDGFFEPGRLNFGEDLHASEIFQAVMALDGVEAACLNRFKRVGKRYPDQSDSGLIRLDGHEIAVCDNDPGRPERGSLRVVVHGGQRG